MNIVLAPRSPSPRHGESQGTRPSPATASRRRPVEGEGVAGDSQTPSHGDNPPSARLGRSSTNPAHSKSWADAGQSLKFLAIGTGAFCIRPAGRQTPHGACLIHTAWVRLAQGLRSPESAVRTCSPSAAAAERRGTCVNADRNGDNVQVDRGCDRASANIDCGRVGIDVNRNRNRNVERNPWKSLRRAKARFCCDRLPGNPRIQTPRRVFLLSTPSPKTKLAGPLRVPSAVRM